MAMPIYQFNAYFSLVRVYIHAMLVLHWLRLTPTHFFTLWVSHPHIASFPLVNVYTHTFFMPWVLQSDIASFPLVMAYTHTFFMPQVSQPCISAFPAVTKLILLTTKCICQLHPVGSPPVKAMNYTSLLQFSYKDFRILKFS